MHAIFEFLKNLHDSGHLQEMVRAGGIPVIAAIVFAETGLLVGFFLPGDTHAIRFRRGRRRRSDRPRASMSWISMCSFPR